LISTGLSGLNDFVKASLAHVLLKSVRFLDELFIFLW